MHHYLNLTGHTVKLKTKKGKIITVEHDKTVSTESKDPFKKIKYPIFGWRKY